jgi:hypothetical protein
VLAEGDNADHEGREGIHGADDSMDGREYAAELKGPLTRTKSVQHAAT